MIDKYGMTGHKLLWHYRRVDEWLRGDRISPLHIDMGITTGCNIACKYCYGMMMNRTNVDKRVDMPLETMKSLWDSCYELGVKSVTISGEGENLLNPHIYDSLTYGKDKVDFGLATNGTILDKYKVKQFMESLVYLRFNISAPNRELYKEIHGVDLFDRAINNIKKCVGYKKEYNLPTTIGLQMVITNDNLHEVKNMAKLGKDLGVDYLVAKPCSDTPDGKLDVPHNEYHLIEEECKIAESLSDENYSVIIKWNKLMNQGNMPYDKCRATPFMIAINGRGDVAPCGHLFTDKFKKGFHMGNINKNTLTEIVDSDRYWTVQNKVLALDVNRDCETNCKQYYINQFLNVVSNPPDHINFV